VFTVEIHRVKIGPANVERLMRIRGPAMVELQRQCPQLRQADLVRLDDDLSVDILTWSGPVDPKRIGRPAQRTPKQAEMHDLIAAELGHDQGERVHTTGTAWAAGR
jgi:hypothetical protein